MKKIDTKLFKTLLIFGYIPTIYITLRVFLLGNLPTDNGINIASQLSWVSLLYEIAQETLILPLFFFLGKSVEDNRKFVNTLKSTLLIGFGLNVIISLFLIIFAKPFVILMAQDISLIYETVDFVRVEAISNVFGILVKVLMVAFILLNKNKGLLVLLSTQMICTIFFDVFFISRLGISLNVGAIGIAYSNLITNIIVFVVGVILLKKYGIRIIGDKFSFIYRLSDIKINVLSGVETLVRNLAFIFMVIRMVNVVGEQGTFWVANNFIWGWLLVPIIQMGELVKKDFSTDKFISKNKFKAYFKLTSIIVGIWFITIPLWGVFFREILMFENWDKVLHIVIISLGCYILFAYNNMCDSVFYAKGRTDLMLYQSLIINIVYYGILFILYLNGIFSPNLNGIALMFGGGIALDSVITFVIFKRYVRKKDILK